MAVQPKVRKKRLKNPRYRIFVRRHLVRLQGGLCCYCGRSFTKRGPTRPTIEHKKAIMNGGTDDLTNLAAACLHCNQHRGTQKNRSKQNAQRKISRIQVRDNQAAPPAPALAVSPSLRLVDSRMRERLGPEGRL